MRPARLISLLAILAIAILGPSIASATPVCPDGDTLSTFLAAGYSCKIGDDILSNFSYTSSASGGAVAIPDAGIGVDTLGPAGSGASISNSDIGLQFNAGWSALGGQVIDSEIGFTVTDLSGTIDDLGLSQTSSVSPNGSVTVVETGCGPGPCTPSTLSLTTYDYGGSNTDRTTDLDFSGVSSVTVLDDIDVSGGSAGVGELSVVTSTFSSPASTPEPSSLALLGTGLLGFARVLRRRR